MLRLAIALAALFAATAAAAVPPEFAARYKISHGAFTVGEARVRFERLPQNRYRYSSLTRPTGITSLIYRTEIAEISEGAITDSGYRPQRYEYERSGRGSRAAELRFDWQRNRVSNSVEGDKWKMEIPDDAMDRLISQLQLMYDLGEGAESLKYPVADGGRLRTYRFEVVGKERISTGLGELDTLRVARINDNPKYATTFWAAPSLNYIPVQIDHRERKDSFRMTLDELEGMPLPEKSQQKKNDFVPGIPRM